MFIHHKFECYLSLYQDGIATYSAYTTHLTTPIRDLQKAFEISDLGEDLFLLGLHMTYISDGIAITQE